MTAPVAPIVQLVCPGCKEPLAANEDGWKCSQCGHAYTRNQGVVSFLSPEERFNESVYEEKQIAAWTTSARLRERIRASRLLTVLNDVRIRLSLSGRRDRLFRDEMRPGAGPHRKILDLGCGGGRHYFCDYGAVVGIDPVLPLLKMAGTMYREVYQTSGFKLPFADGSFDYVVSSDVLGHISAGNKDLLFQEIHRVLKPGGRTVHCSEADGQNFWFRFAHRYPELFAVYFVDRPGHIGLERPTDLRQRFLRHGFREVAFKRLNSVIQEPGTLVALFDNEYATKSRWIRWAVAIDRVLTRSFAVRELINFALEPLAKLEDACTDLNSTSFMVGNQRC